MIGHHLFVAVSEREYCQQSTRLPMRHLQNRTTARVIAALQDTGTLSGGSICEVPARARLKTEHYLQNVAHSAAVSGGNYDEASCSTTDVMLY